MTKPCHCCEGGQTLTPRDTTNRPGLDDLNYRVGTHATFLETMKARLSGQAVEVKSPADPEQVETLYPLRDLTTRDPHDPSMAFLDAWATVADVLTFYQERIANEGYLRTAIERRSLLELGRLVGYKPRPGVASSVYLAFMMEQGVNDGAVPKGTRVQSVPGPGELPQSFETSETIPAQAAWNVLRPRLNRPQTIVNKADAESLSYIYFDGIGNNLQPGLPLLFVFDDDPKQATIRWIEKVELDPAANRTKVTLQEEIGAAPSTSRPGESSPAFAAASIAGPNRVAQTQQVIEKYLDLEQFGISAGKMAGEVQTILENVSAKITPDIPPETLAELLEEALSALRKSHTTAVEREYGQLEPWLRSLIAEFEGIVSALSASQSSAAEGYEMTPANNPGAAATGMTARSAQIKEIGQDGETQSILKKLAAIIEPLSTPSNEQVRNARYLTKDITKLLGPDGDTLLQMVRSLEPVLVNSIYSALQNISASVELPDVKVYALRLNTSPFGHNAPLEPDYNDDNVIDGYTEWDLVYPEKNYAAINLQGHSTLLDGGFLYISFGYRQGDVEESASVSTSSDEPSLEEEVQIGPISAKISIKKEVVSPDPPIEYEIVEIAIEMLGQTMIIRSGEAGAYLNVQIDDQQQDLEIDDSEINISGNLVSLRQIRGEGTYEQLQIARLPKLLPLDAIYEKIISNSWAVIRRPDDQTEGPKTIIARVNGVGTVSLAAYNMAARVSQLELNRTWLPSSFASANTNWMLSFVRNTTVYAQSELLTPANEPIDETIGPATNVPLQEQSTVPRTVSPYKQADLAAARASASGQDSRNVTETVIELDGVYDGLNSGRWLILAGERTDVIDIQGNVIPGIPAKELVMLAGVQQRISQARGDTPHTFLILDKPLAYSYKRDTVEIYANVVEATHGETKEEVLGSGQASQAFQTFALGKSPLTYISAPNAAGVDSSLEVRVNDVRWPEADNLTELAAEDRRFITRTNNEGQTSVIFGNGERGKRLPTGVENITAVYRFGIGQGGNVAAAQIKLLAGRPLGVKGVINPLPASGGADREGPTQIRRNAPLAFKALDRLVSAEDYADFAQTFAGIDKATAVSLSNGQRETIYLTVAGLNDTPIDKTAMLYRNLVLALRRRGDPQQYFELLVRNLIIVVISADVRIDPDYQWEIVESQMRAALLDAFGFENRALGQDVRVSEVISVAQNIPGVLYVDVNAFGGIPEEKDDRGVLDIEKIIEAVDKLTSSSPSNIYAASRISVSTTSTEYGLKPAQIAYLRADIPETLVLNRLDES